MSGYKPEWDLKLHVGELAESDFAKIVQQAHIECKADKACRNTGRVAIEIRQGTPGRPSGISVTTAEWWAIEFADDRWVFIRTSLLKAIVRAEMKARGTVIGGDNHNELVLVPIGRLFQSLRAA